jgi:DNA-binding response OmpR family regulator
VIPDSPRRILVVDDDREIVEMTRMILEGGGYKVVPALSGQEALDRVSGARPDLILLDINMPGMDGWEVLKLLKVDEETREIPVAMFSIKFELRDKVLGLKEGAFDYITKPFSCDDLLRRVARIFRELSGGGDH